MVLMLMLMLMIRQQWRQSRPCHHLLVRNEMSMMSMMTMRMMMTTVLMKMENDFREEVGSRGRARDLRILLQVETHPVSHLTLMLCARDLNHRRRMIITMHLVIFESSKFM